MTVVDRFDGGSRTLTCSAGVHGVPAGTEPLGCVATEAAYNEAYCGQRALTRGMGTL